MEKQKLQQTLKTLFNEISDLMERYPTRNSTPPTSLSRMDSEEEIEEEGEEEEENLEEKIVHSTNLLWTVNPNFETHTKYQVIE